MVSCRHCYRASTCFFCFSFSPLLFRELWRSTKISLLLNDCWNGGSSSAGAVVVQNTILLWSHVPFLYCSRFHSLLKPLTMVLCFLCYFMNAGSQAVLNLSLKISYLSLQSLCLFYCYFKQWSKQVSSTKLDDILRTGYTGMQQSCTDLSDYIQCNLLFSLSVL